MDARLSRGHVSSPPVEEQARLRSRASLGAGFAVRAGFIWPALGAGLGLLGWGLYRAWGAGASPVGMVLRVLGAVAAAAAMWLLVRTLLADGGRPGTAVVTLVYVLVGIVVQFLLGLGLAYLLTQALPGQ